MKLPTLTKLWPRSLSSQLIALIVLAVVLAQAASLWVFHDERRIALATVARDNILSRSVATAKLLEDSPAHMHQKILEAASSRFSQFWLSPTPTVAASDTKSPLERSLAKAIRQRFADDRQINLDLSRPGPKEFDPKRFNQKPPNADEEKVRTPEEERQRLIRHLKKLHEKRIDLSLSIQLKDGSWFNVLTNYRPPDRSIVPMLVQMGITIVVVSVLAAFLMRRVSRPLRSLAGAADKLGRGEKTGPLAEEGPIEVVRVTHAFNEMQNRLMRFVEDRTRMLAAISHDLRTPITSLRLRAEFIEDEENREKIISTLEEMNQMTEATLDFVRDEVSKENGQRMDLASLLQSLADDQQDLGHDVESADGGRLVLRCRPVALKRALRNIIENGVRYGKSVKIFYEQEDGHANIRFVDQGPGIPEERQKEVFEPFVRLEESRNEETGGIGLGLSISRSIIHGHGGTIALNNLPEGGLEVLVCLPIEKPH